jgi:hypothetical protein
VVKALFGAFQALTRSRDPTKAPGARLDADHFADNQDRNIRSFGPSLHLVIPSVCSEIAIAPETLPTSLSPG